MKTYNLTLTALFATITAVCSWITIPLPFTPVPINMATFAVIISGLVLGPKYGTISQLLYIFLGVVGLPVFSGFTSGIGIILGPTGGYLISYILIALIVGASKNFNIIIGLILGTMTCYFFGSIWFMVLTGSNFTTTIALCVIPFILGDTLKLLLAYYVFKRIPGRYIITE